MANIAEHLAAKQLDIFPQELVKTKIHERDSVSSGGAQTLTFDFRSHKLQ